jgi:hypothetical protein
MQYQFRIKKISPEYSKISHNNPESSIPNHSQLLLYEPQTSRLPTSKLASTNPNLLHQLFTQILKDSHKCFPDFPILSSLFPKCLFPSKYPKLQQTQPQTKIPSPRHFQIKTLRQYLNQSVNGYEDTIRFIMVQTAIVLLMFDHKSCHTEEICLHEYSIHTFNFSRGLIDVVSENFFLGIIHEKARGNGKAARRHSTNCLASCTRTL